MKTTKIVLLNMVIFFAFVQGVYANETVWIGGDGNWDIAANWDNGLPDASKDATINTGTITIPSGYSASASIVNVSGHLIINGTLSTGGNLVLENGSKLTNAGTLHLFNGSNLVMNGDSHFINNGYVKVEGALNLNNTSIFDNNSNGYVDVEGNITIANGAAFNNAGHVATNGTVTGVINNTGSGTLPVELLSFTVSTNNGLIAINWQTATELNSDYFEIERSKDGENWEVLGSRTAAGNSNQMINYDFLDMTPNSGANYYRLIQVDYDGTTEIFGPIHQNIGDYKEAISMKVYPNPTLDGNVHIELSQNIKSGDIMEISDFSGRLLKTIVMNDGCSNQVINVSDLPKGIYIIRYISNDQELTKKLIL